MRTKESEVKMAAKLYECRDSAKSMCKMLNADYKEKLAPYIEILESKMKSEKLNPITALVAISKSDFYENNGIAQLYFMAAVVEILEPNN